MTSRRIITHETPAIWYHKGEIVTDTATGVIGRPWCATETMTIEHGAVEHAALIVNSKPVPATKKRNK